MDCKDVMRGKYMFIFYLLIDAVELEGQNYDQVLITLLTISSMFKVR